MTFSVEYRFVLCAPCPCWIWKATGTMAPHLVVLMHDCNPLPLSVDWTGDCSPNSDSFSSEVHAEKGLVFICLTIFGSLTCFIWWKKDSVFWAALKRPRWQGTERCLQPTGNHGREFRSGLFLSSLYVMPATADMLVFALRVVLSPNPQEKKYQDPWFT